MKIRRFEPSDMDGFLKTYDKYYHHEVPLSLSSATAVVENDAGNPVAYGLLVPHLEAVTVIDKEAKSEEILSSIGALIKVAKKRAQKLLISHLIVYVEDNSFANALENRFDFQRVKGVTLALEVNKNGDG